jgi:hypothetical protein
MDHRRFTFRHVRQCFPSIGSSTLQYWADRGYLAFGREEHGDRHYMVFSWPEIVHIGVVLQLSLWGVFRRGATLGVSWSDAQGAVKIADTIRPDPFISLYRRYRFHVAVTILSLAKKREKGDPRTADASIMHWIKIGSPMEAEFLFKGLFPDRPDRRANFPSLGFISVRILADHVCRILQITPLPD